MIKETSNNLSRGIGLNILNTQTMLLRGKGKSIFMKEFYSLFCFLSDRFFEYEKYVYIIQKFYLIF